MGIKIKLIIAGIILLIIGSVSGYIIYLKYTNNTLQKENTTLQITNQTLENTIKEEQRRFNLIQQNTKKQQQIDKILNNVSNVNQDNIIVELNKLFYE